MKILMQSRLISGFFRAFSGVKMAKTRSGEDGFVVDSQAILCKMPGLNTQSNTTRIETYGVDAVISAAPTGFEYPIQYNKD